MSVLVTKPAPNFKTQALMPNGTFKEVSLTDYRGKYVLLFFYPLDFTFVCPTEIIAFSEAVPEFEKLNVQILACSVDSHFTHFAWANTPRKLGGLGNIKYPILSDLKHSVVESYGVLADDGTALRGVFLIDKDGIVMHETVNAPPIGRNVEEELRTLKALQFFEKKGEVCPANWQEGKDGINPSKSSEYFAKVYE
ncbi:MAG: peroxiredoxin [Planctomycetaceae bacterium]|jgi:peroxiredoxin (alkyl hydroperoxide reductase subunit C)|nr:peroxiredoxin [Planctomycetaceae bacterium]